jgi:pimeloyl-ACP methyl ester carboxylesterase
MELNYKMFGHGNPLIILHGVFGMLDNWQHFAKLLAKDYWVTTPDLRNHGRSPHSEIFDYKTMTDDLVYFMEQHGIKKANLAGHSMGGKLAMTVALEHSEYVERLIVIDIGIKAYPPKHNYIFDALCSLDISKFSNRKEIENKILEKIPEKRIVQFLLKNIKREKKTGKFQWKMNLKAIKDNYDKINKTIESDYTFSGDVLFIKGEDSDYILEKDKAQIQKLFPNAKFVTIKNAGHWVHAEQPDKLMQVINDFL